MSPKTQTRPVNPQNRLQPKIWPPKPGRNRCVQTQPKSRNRAESPAAIVRRCIMRASIILWEHGAGSLHKDSSAHNFPPQGLLGKSGVAIQRMSLNATLFSGDIFGDHVAPLVPRNEADLVAIWCFCEFDVFAEELKRVDLALKASVSSFLKVPIDFSQWKVVADKRYPHGLPTPKSDDPTQWLFEGLPTYSSAPLNVGVARLVGYHWPRLERTPIIPYHIRRL